MSTIPTRPQLDSLLSSGGRTYRVTAIAAPVVVATCERVKGREPDRLDEIKIFIIK